MHGLNRFWLRNESYRKIVHPLFIFGNRKSPCRGFSIWCAGQILELHSLVLFHLASLVRKSLSNPDASKAVCLLRAIN
jgi:hypothetical protein